MKKSRKETTKKTLALLLAMVMVLAVAPFAAIAEDAVTTADQIVDEGGKLWYDEDGNDLDEVDAWAVSVSKTIAPKANENEFTITLAVETTQDISELEVSPDLAVVLVIDVSTSMMYQITSATNGTYYNSTDYNTYKNGTSRIAIAKTAARAFLESYVNGAGNAKRMVSLVTFGSNANVRQDWVDANTTTGLADIYAAIDSLIASSGEYTFLQGGLQLASNMLGRNAVNGILTQNQFVVTLTDGNPTYRKATLSANDKLPSATQITGAGMASTSGGTSVETESNVPVCRNFASSVADEIRIKGIKLFTIAAGTPSDTFSEDTPNTGTKITAADWLATRIAYNSSYHYNANNVAALKLAFDKISTSISSWAEAWTVTDPMGLGIVFNGTVDGKATILAGSQLTWDLKEWLPTSSNVGDGVTIYKYVYSYDIILDTFVRTDVGDTNGATELTYVIWHQEDSVLNRSNPVTVEFLVPSVKGYTADLLFFKVDEDGYPLEGATFVLKCGDDYSTQKVSDTSGAVLFADIPSGHEYTLEETGTLPDYVRDVTIYTVKVSYGNISISPDNKALTAIPDGGYVFTNKLKNSDADIEKSVYSINGIEDLSDWKTNANGDYIVENGDEIIYKIVVENTGDRTLTLLDIADDLAGAVRCDENGVTESLGGIGGTLMPGDSVTVYYKYTVSGVENGAIKNTATASFNEIPDIEDDETVQVAAPIISIKKEITTASDESYNGSSLFPNGADITFQITITNSGDADDTASFSDYISRLGINTPITNYTVDPASAENSDGTITVKANSEVVIFYNIVAEGQTDTGWEDDVNDAIAAVGDAYAAYQKAIDDAMEAVGLMQAAVQAAEQALDEAQKAYDAAVVENLYDADGEIIGEFYPDGEDAALEDAQIALADAVAALQDAQDALDKLIVGGDFLADIDDPDSWVIAAAEAALQGLVDNKVPQVFVYENHAAFGNNNASISFAVDYQRQSFLTLKKEVSVNGGAKSKFAPAEAGDYVEFTITVKNIGNKPSEPMTLIDSFGGVDIQIDVPSIGPNEEYPIILSSEDYDWSGVIVNDSYTAAKLATNTAVLYNINGDAVLSSSASVVVRPQPIPIIIDPPVVVVPVNPPTGGGGGGSPYVPPVIPVIPTPVVVEAPPAEEEAVIEIAPPEVPLAIIPVVEEEIPVVIDIPAPEIVEEIELDEPDVPLGQLPQTGLLSIYSLLFLLGAVLVTIGVFTKKYMMKISKAKH